MYPVTASRCCATSSPWEDSRGKIEERKAQSLPCRSDFIGPEDVSFRVTRDSEGLPARLSDIIDYIEKMREELLTIQRSLEKLEPTQSAAPEQRDISK